MSNPKQNKIILLSTWLLSGLILLNSAIFFPSTTSAQALDEIDNSDSLALDINPRFPKPGETVKLHLSGYGFSLEQSIVSWYINKDRKKTGTGLRDFSFQAPNLGDTATVGVIVTTPTNSRIVKQVSFTPATIDFLVQADSYTPLGYKGAALPGPYTKVKVVALPNIKNGNSYVPPDRVNFTWEQDGQSQTNQNGVGKDYFIFYTKGYPSATNLHVTAKAINTGVVAENSTTISTVAPDITLYPYLPLSGVKLQALTDTFPNEGEVSIKAEPYYLNREAVNSGTFIYNFTVNNKQIINKESLTGLLNLIIDRNSDLATINLNLVNLTDRLQEYQKNFTLKTPTFNAFGQ